MQVSAVSISINDLLQIGPQETVLPGVMIVIDPNTLHVPPVNSSSTSYRKVIGHLQKYALGTYFRRTLYDGIATLQPLYGGWVRNLLTHEANAILSFIKHADVPLHPFENASALPSPSAIIAFE